LLRCGTIAQDSRIHIDRSTGCRKYKGPWLDWIKGERVFEIVDAQTYKVLKRVDMGEKLKEFGRPWIDSAVRPMAVAPEECRVRLERGQDHPRGRTAPCRTKSKTCPTGGTRSTPRIMGWRSTLRATTLCRWNDLGLSRDRRPCEL